MQPHIGAAGLVAAVLLAEPQFALAQGAPFCLKSASGALNCAYNSMILCEQAKQPHSADQCIPRLQADVTTGSSAAPLGSPRPRGAAPAAIHQSPAR
jgi:hypothetical protein